MWNIGTFSCRIGQEQLSEICGRDPNKTLLVLSSREIDIGHTVRKIEGNIAHHGTWNPRGSRVHGRLWNTWRRIIHHLNTRKLEWRELRKVALDGDQWMTVTHALCSPWDDKDRWHVSKNCLCSCVRPQAVAYPSLKFLLNVTLSQREFELPGIGSYEDLLLLLSFGKLSITSSFLSSPSFPSPPSFPLQPILSLPLIDRQMTKITTMTKPMPPAAMHTGTPIFVQSFEPAANTQKCWMLLFLQYSHFMLENIIFAAEGRKLQFTYKTNYGIDLSEC